MAGKWALPILRELADGPKGHNELLRALHVEHRSLDRALRRLEDARVVSRDVQPTPLRVRYRLTPGARPLLLELSELADVWRDHCRAGEGGRRWPRGGSNAP